MSTDSISLFSAYASLEKHGSVGQTKVKPWQNKRTFIVYHQNVDFHHVVSISEMASTAMLGNFFLPMT
jgi:hypothetical protein